MMMVLNPVSVYFKPLPSRELLRQIFDYDASQGRLIWKSHPRKNQQWRIGTVAGSRHKEGGWQICLNTEIYLHCRLVWAWHHGDPGSVEIDHEDENRANDRLDNLRLATCQQNQWNRSVTSRNTSGHKGVSWYKRLGKWRVDVRQKTIGYFDDLDEAIRVREETAKQLCGDFAK